MNDTVILRYGNKCYTSILISYLAYFMKFKVTRAYDALNDYWHKQVTAKIISTALIVVFIVSILVVFITNSGLLGNYEVPLDFFLAIDASFTTLLIFEILELIFVLPKSVADSVGKQFEILSIILLRSAFKEFGHTSPALMPDSIDYMGLLPMISDALGALVIFIIIGFYYKMQRHEQITQSEKDQQRFIDFKKLIALILLAAFFVIGFMDIQILFLVGTYNPSFNNFYTLLIFADILILLYSLRYQSQYTNLFRYSSYAFATILIRLALSAPPYLNVTIGIVAGSFVLGLTFVYNKFRAQ